jgi:hypothetical protein
MEGNEPIRQPNMDFYPENIPLEIISLLNAPAPPGAALTGMEPGIALTDLSFIWWLEYFLRAEPAAFEEKFESLPWSEQRVLVSRVWYCFLHQPLLQRLFPSEYRPEILYPWKVIRAGSLLQLTVEAGESETTGLYYVFPHRRLWPGLAARLQGKVALSPEDLNLLQPGIDFALKSRLEAVRGRAEGLRSILRHSDREPMLEEDSPPMDRKPDPGKLKSKPPRKKKKTSGQLRLFD